jgi:hypothetical protein
MRAVRAVGTVAALAGGCRAAPVAPDIAGAPAPAASGPRCESPADALAWVEVDGEPCGHRLVGGDEPNVASLRPGAAETPVELPERCTGRSCEYELLPSRLGPLIRASRRGPDSELPDWVGIGVPFEGRYRFVDVWIGRGVATDFTPAGRAFELAPHDCGGRLAFLAVPGAGAAADEAPDPALRAAEGVYTWEDGELAVSAVDPATCARLF